MPGDSVTSWVWTVFIFFLADITINWQQLQHIVCCCIVRGENDSALPLGTLNGNTCLGWRCQQRGAQREIISVKSTGMTALLHSLFRNTFFFYNAFSHFFWRISALKMAIGWKDFRFTTSERFLQKIIQQKKSPSIEGWGASGEGRVHPGQVASS